MRQLPDLFQHLPGHGGRQVLTAAAQALETVHGDPVPVPDQRRGGAGVEVYALRAGVAVADGVEERPYPGLLHDLLSVRVCSIGFATGGAWCGGSGIAGLGGGEPGAVAACVLTPVAVTRALLAGRPIIVLPLGHAGA